VLEAFVRGSRRPGTRPARTASERILALARMDFLTCAWTTSRNAVRRRTWQRLSFAPGTLGRLKVGLDEQQGIGMRRSAIDENPHVGTVCSYCSRDL
jgi:hypothetical protein